MTDKPIPDPNQISPIKPVGAEEVSGGMPSVAQPFSSFMAKAPATSPQTSSLISPFSLMQGNTPVTTTPSVDSLLEQLGKTQGVSSDVQNQLKTPNLKLKASTKYLLNNKLSEANSHLRALNTQIGAPVPEETNTSSGTGPLGKFLSYVAQGQQMMESAKAQLANIKNKGEAVSPGDFLLVQLKVNKAQQLLEFSSILLSNAVSSIKQFMQVQL